MQTKIAEYKGYTVAYETDDKEFKLLDRDREIVGSGKTQEGVETQADKLLKNAWSFPIEAIREGAGYFNHGKVTSMNPGNGSLRFVYDRDKGDAHSTKEYLGNPGVYEATEKNMALFETAKAKRKQIEELNKELDALAKGLEKPMNFEYFGLQEKRGW